MTKTLNLTEKRSAPIDNIPFTIEFPATWTPIPSDGEARFELLRSPAYAISYINIAQVPARLAQQTLISEAENFTQKQERHSGLDMTVLDWTNNGSSCDIECGWGTTGSVTPAQASTAERACFAAVNSIEAT